MTPAVCRSLLVAAGESELPSTLSRPVRIFSFAWLCVAPLPRPRQGVWLLLALVAACQDLSIRANRRKDLGCTILRDACFWPDNRWLPWNTAQGWAPNIVQGKTETDPHRARLLLDALAVEHRPLPPDLGDAFEPVELDDRTWIESHQVRREGQGTFRLRLLDLYGGCAITGEKTQPVLDAAHIQPYLGPASNHVQNGLVLTKEFHTLFDKGYVTVTPDLVVRVSEALREDWQNGVRYYAHDRQPLRRLPSDRHAQPSREALAWHREAVFLG